jgi:predicted O-methyltransferase YrrM
MIRSTLNKIRGLMRGGQAKLAGTGKMAADPFEAVELNRNEGSWMEPDKLGSFVPSYKPTYIFDGYINEGHEAFTTCPVKEGILVDLGMPGWLRREDALKIYELAYYSPGDILELGTYQGLSTSIISKAIADSGGKKRLVTVDMSPDYSRAAVGYLTERGLDGNVSFFVSDATSFCQKLIAEGRKFSFIFVDHSHEYQPVFEACQLMAQLIYPRGLSLFHDFNDPRNNDPENKDYGVSQAVLEGLPIGRFEFHGIFGCTALYRAKIGK